MTHYFEDTSIPKPISLHKVGNATAEEFLSLSKAGMTLPEDMLAILKRYFLPHFKSEEYFRFYHEADLSMNEVYRYVSAIFDDPDSLHEQSLHLAKHLYNHSTHPKIKGGEFYTVYFENCTLDGETVSAVGLFKSENKDTFLEVTQDIDRFDMESYEGVNINKLDKGCIIFNAEREDGFVLSVVDNTNKGQDAQYWKDDFLKIAVINNGFHQTQQFLGIAR